MTTDNTARLRRRALRELRAARDVMGLWVDQIRGAAEIRVNATELDQVLDDPAFWEAMGLFRQVNDAIARFAATAEQIEAGERE